MHYFQAEVGNMGGHGIVGGQIRWERGPSPLVQKTGGVAFTFWRRGEPDVQRIA
jgi:hypothetical protein